MKIQSANHDETHETDSILPNDKTGIYFTEVDLYIQPEKDALKAAVESIIRSALFINPDSLDAKSLEWRLGKIFAFPTSVSLNGNAGKVIARLGEEIYVLEFFVTE